MDKALGWIGEIFQTLLKLLAVAGDRAGHARRRRVRARQARQGVEAGPALVLAGRDDLQDSSPSCARPS